MEKIREKATEEKIIFLGDYIDPYPQERITDEQALENFKEIDGTIIKNILKEDEKVENNVRPSANHN